jgi:hypothetical protein
VHEFPANAHVRAYAITADFGSKLIRNQQVVSSSLTAGSRFPNKSTEYQLSGGNPLVRGQQLVNSQARVENRASCLRSQLLRTPY